ncbi:hypothetical protein [Paracidovorax wautersii]|uniref:hypothetical protein n=1 Tax=Paracidovorax wautersii TaxID=1177982 RepID=UPI001113B870|nr:hypothetical protein [Paracidovorax wautersii]
MSHNKEQVAVKEKAHTAVSLPRALAAEVNAVADQAGRSSAKQLEHSFRIAQAIEQILPTATVQALKGGALNGAQLLAGLAAVLEAPAASAALKRAMDANPSRIHVDPRDPTRAIQTNADGTTTVGRLLENGDFAPDPSSQPAPKKGRASHVTEDQPGKTAKIQAKSSPRHSRSARVAEPA